MHHERRKDGHVSIRHAEGNDVETPPEERLAEVVRVPRVTPQACLAELALIWILVGDVASELGVTDSFEQATDKISPIK